MSEKRGVLNINIDQMIFDFLIMANDTKDKTITVQVKELTDEIIKMVDDNS